MLTVTYSLEEIMKRINNIVKKSPLKNAKSKK